MTSRLLAVPLLTIALLAGCATPAPPATPASGCKAPDDFRDAGCTSESQWLRDDLDLDSYLLDGVIDGVRFATVVCALNLDPSLFAYRDGDSSAGSPQMVLFQATDNTLESGTADGVWDLEGGPGNFAELRDGRWTRTGVEEMKDDGTIELTAIVRRHHTDPEPGHADIQVSTTFTLTAVPTSEHCIATTNVTQLTEEVDELPIGPWK